MRTRRTVRLSLALLAVLAPVLGAQQPDYAKAERMLTWNTAPRTMRRAALADRLTRDFAGGQPCTATEVILSMLRGSPRRRNTERPTGLNKRRCDVRQVLS